MSKELEFPYSKEAEHAVLACLLQHDAAMDEVSPLLTPDDFYVGSKWHPEIYQAMQTLYHQGEMITVAAVERLVANGQNEDLYFYLRCLLEDGLHFFDGPYHAKIVAADALRRKLMRHGGQTMADAANDPDAKAVLERAEARLFALGKASGTDDPVTLDALSLDYDVLFTALEQRKGELSGLSSGFGALDFLTGGLEKTDLVILAGRPGTGKSSLALSIAYNIIFAKEWHRVALFSLEMSKHELFRRLVSMRAHIDGKRLRMPWVLHENEKVRVRQAILDLGDIGHDRLCIDDTQSISTVELRSKARRLRAKYGIDLIIVDYLQLMHGLADDGKRVKERYLEIGEISQRLKGLAKELNVPILALAQLSRAVENRADKVPQLSDLRESGNLEQDSDIVLFTYNQEQSALSKVTVIIAKHRNGPVGEVSLGFCKSETRFFNCDEQDQEVRHPYAS
jgi:replicative DNA helicase